MLYEEKFKEEHDRLQKIRHKVIPLQEQYDESRLAAKCEKCSIGIEDLQRDFYSRSQNCKIGIKCGKVHKAYDALCKQKHVEDEIREEYAQKVYSFLSEIKPDLLNREDKKVYHWDDVFGSEFELLSNSLKNALVAMIEMVGGRYRIVD